MIEFFIIILISAFVLIYSSKEKSPKNLENILYSGDSSSPKEIHRKEKDSRTTTLSPQPHEGFKDEFDYIDMAGIDDIIYDDFDPAVVSEDLLRSIKGGD